MRNRKSVHMLWAGLISKLRSQVPTILSCPRSLNYLKLSSDAR